MGLAEPLAIVPGVEVTVYPVTTALPPGAVNVTVACALPAVATTFVGASRTAVNEISFSVCSTGTCL